MQIMNATLLKGNLLRNSCRYITGSVLTQLGVSKESAPQCVPEHPGTFAARCRSGGQGLG
jgi:hypothetical protein